jgi:hypothetical protein
MDLNIVFPQFWLEFESFYFNDPRFLLIQIFKPRNLVIKKLNFNYFNSFLFWIFQKSAYNVGLDKDSPINLLLLKFNCKEIPYIL